MRPILTPTLAFLAVVVGGGLAVQVDARDFS
jgi:hypothetical protein